MKFSYSKPSIRARSGFTMVELALCIAIVAIAMVALIGILPTGLTVQQQSREEVLMAKEAQYWFDVIRNGSTSLNTLTNYVESIQLVRRFEGGSTFTNDAGYYSGIYDPAFEFKGPPSGPAHFANGLWDATRIIGLVSRPKYETLPDGPKRFVTVTNQAVYVYMRPASGPVTERPYLGTGDLMVTNGVLKDQSFRYRATIEVSTVYSRAAENLSDIRITMQWPVINLPLIENGFLKRRIGPNTRTYRAQVAGTPVVLRGTNLAAIDLSSAFSTNSLARPTYLYRFQPGTL